MNTFFFTRTLFCLTWYPWKRKLRTKRKKEKKRKKERKKERKEESKTETQKVRERKKDEPGSKIKKSLDRLTR